MLTRVTISLALLALLAGCGDDSPPKPARAEQPETVATASPDAEAMRLQAALAKLGIEAKGLGPMEYDSTKRLLAFPVSAQEALSAWTKLRAHVDGLQRWPLVMQKPEDLLGNVSPKDYPEGVAGILAKAEKLNSGLWLDQRERDDPEYYRKAPVGAWAAVQQGTRWGFPTDYKGKPAEGLVIALVPTTRPWEVCAWFFQGGWNACPEPEVHVAVQKRWHREYGAEIVFMSSDVIEMLCPRRPATRDAALILAREHFLYSGGDLIYQGLPGMRELASELLANSAWYFWWD